MNRTADKEQLNNLDKETLITLVVSMQTQVELLTKQIELLNEQIALMNSRQYSKKSEQNLGQNEQLTMYAMFDSCFNEAEALLEKGIPSEPEFENVVVAEHRRKKRKGKRDEDLSKFPVSIVEHYLSEEEANEMFPDGYTRLEDYVYRKLEMHPATFEVLEHHVGVYKGKDGNIYRVPRTKEMLEKSIATPSLVAAVMNSKYTNAVPLYRLEQEFERNDISISRQVMANWMITTAERYLSLVYDRMRQELLTCNVVHADETPVTVSKDGREGTHNSYMWVYRTGGLTDSHQAVLYDYQKTRKLEAPAEFLKGYSGTLVTDGYEVYHSLERDASTTLTVAGCWAHAKRKFAEIIKAVGEKKSKGTIANEAVVQIQNMYRVDNQLLKLSPKERLEKRNILLRPMIDAFFKWATDAQSRVMPGSATGKAIHYCLHQEQYLRTFLNDPEIPMDNNAAERSIRPFCVGKKNWMMIDTVHGAEASAIIYSMVETAKANNLNIHYYLRHLLTEIPKYVDGTSTDFIEELLPWSESLPDECRKKTRKN